MCLVTMAYVDTASAVCATNFSTGGKFCPVSNCTELHALTLAAHSYALLTTIKPWPLYHRYWQQPRYMYLSKNLDLRHDTCMIKEHTDNWELKQVQQTRRLLNQWVRWCHRNFTCRQETHISSTQICACTNFTVHTQKRAAVTWDKQILSVKATHSWIALLEILSGLCATPLHAVPWVRLKPLIPMDTDLHACRCEVNQNSVMMPRLNQKLAVMF